MAELRMDFLTKEWVAISVDRGRRPFNFIRDASPAAEAGRCPFCPENSDLRANEQRGRGDVIFLPNLYPALDPQSENGFGRHEIIVDSPDHRLRLHELSDGGIFDVLATLRDRVAFYQQDRRIEYIQVFKNSGFRAGASIPHAHWQLLAMPFVPRRVQVMADSFDDFKAENGVCYLCRPADKRLTVCENGGAAAYVPFAALFPYCVNIAPRAHYKSLAAADDGALASVGALLKKSVTALFKKGFGDYNILLFEAPAGSGKDTGNWHFFFQIVPKLGSPAGFELASYTYMSSVFPEDAALELREELGTDHIERHQ